jgi:hypothetical protein
VFGLLAANGSAGPDLGPAAAAAGDEKKLAQELPAIEQIEGKKEDGSESDSIHQATNSLSITLCRRADPSCVVGVDNTFVFTIFHRKLYRDWHSTYEPYVMMFRQGAPFNMRGVSKKPIWVRGRKDEKELIYIVSMSWKSKTQRYHGYLDDVLFLSFGVEDKETSAIDVLAADLLKEFA